jgi:hypothetical protein
LTIGRAEGVGLRIADEALAPVHLEVGWDGAQAQVSHRGGRALTMVDGQAIEYAQIGHGQWIRAGNTDFTFHVEAFTPLQSRVSRILAAAAERALAGLRGKDGLYAILDVARDPRIAELMREAVEPCLPLFDGLEAARQAEAAPQLVALSADSRLLADLVREGWGARWTAWMTSSREPTVVRRHLRQFLLANIPGEADPVYFRFYDPDVLRVVLETSTAARSGQSAVTRGSRVVRIAAPRRVDVRRPGHLSLWVPRQLRRGQAARHGDDDVAHGWWRCRPRTCRSWLELEGHQRDDLEGRSSIPPMRAMNTRSPAWGRGRAVKTAHASWSVLPSAPRPRSSSGAPSRRVPAGSVDMMTDL